VPGEHVNRGTKRAREARATLGCSAAGPLPCLLTIVEEDAGIPVLLHRLPGDVAGCFWHDGDRRLIHVNAAHGLPRRRFTLAHELGHAWMGHDGAVVVDDVHMLGGRTASPRELEANAFAAEFLVPARGLEELLGGEPPTLDTLVVLAAGFGVSAIAVLYRCVSCGLAGDDRARRLEAEIGEGLHLARHAELRPPVIDDRLAAIDALPYLSPALAGSELAVAASAIRPDRR
jgi:Zn-dependent peptidase ImmA (M78 family)